MFNRRTAAFAIGLFFIAASAGPRPAAADDAKNCALFSFDNLPEQLAFDHAQVLADYKRYRETGEVTDLKV